VLLRFDPFRDRPRLSHGQWSGPASRQSNGMPFDAYRQGDTFFAHFDMPGIDPSSIELTVENNVLTVSAERTQPWGDGVELLVSERPSGSFTRQLFLGESLGSDLIVASCDNGVLTVAIPVAEKAQPRKVEIGHTNGQSAPVPAHASA
jgi:HSP20 family protein